jgi:uncharacterized membrane protein YhaH (DUF805 family)
MGLVHYLFGFSGRINRAKQWAILLVGLLFSFLAVIAFAVTVGFATVADDITANKMDFAEFMGTSQVHAFGFTMLALYVLMLYVTAAVTTKRLHDRNKSAIWLLVFVIAPLVLNIPRYLEIVAIFSHFDAFIKQAQAAAQTGQPPFVETPLVVLTGGAASLISLWAFVELYCLRGTVGDNRYGPDPLAGKA